MEALKHDARVAVELLAYFSKHYEYAVLLAGLKLLPEGPKVTAFRPAFVFNPVTRA
jgi:hypothetical protein